MKILLDMNLSPAWVPFFKKHGYEAKHWSTIGSASAPDAEVMEWARKNGYEVFTHDLDFGSLLYVTNASSPSVIQLRCEDVRPQSVGEILIRALERVQEEINRGALIIVNVKKNRIRLLPLRGRND